MEQEDKKSKSWFWLIVSITLLLLRVSTIDTQFRTFDIIQALAAAAFVLYFSIQIAKESYEKNKKE